MVKFKKSLNRGKDKKSQFWQACCYALIIRRMYSWLANDFKNDVLSILICFVNYMFVELVFVMPDSIDTYA